MPTEADDGRFRKRRGANRLQGPRMRTRPSAVGTRRQGLDGPSGFVDRILCAADFLQELLPGYCYVDGGLGPGKEVELARRRRCQTVNLLSFEDCAASVGGGSWADFGLTPVIAIGAHDCGSRS